MLEAFGNHEGNRLAITRHGRAGEHRVGLSVVSRALIRRVVVGEDKNDARRLLRGACIDRFDLSFSDRSFDHKAIQRVLLHLVGVAGAAGDFQPPVDTIERFADNALRADIECIRADG